METNKPKKSKLSQCNLKLLQDDDQIKFFDQVDYFKYVKIFIGTNKRTTSNLNTFMFVINVTRMHKLICPNNYPV